MSNRLRMIRVRERANGWMNDNARPRFDCHQDLTELCKQPYPDQKRWITSDQVTPRMKRETK